jgi:Zn-dependent protease with chaperone function
MLPKLLAWIAFAAALLASLLAVAGLFGGEALGELGPMLILWGSIPLLCVAMLVAVAVLVMGIFR